MRIVVLSIFLSLLPATSTIAGPLTGRVVDPDGQPVRGAHVILLESGFIGATATTDRHGSFALAAPDTGRYELRVALEGFRAQPLAVTAVAGPLDVGMVTLTVSAVAESIVVSASHVEIPVSQTSASVTVISGAELDARQFENVADALRTVPGLTVTAAGGRGAVTSLFPRGGESDYTLVFVDGVQANAFGGGYDLAHLPAANIERIEIVRGPQSALYGSNAIGSVVRIITRQGGPLAGGGSLEGGSFGTRRLTAFAAGSRGEWEWGASAERLDSDGMNGRWTSAGEQIVNDDYTRASATLVGGWRAAAGAAVRGAVRYARDERGYPGPFGSNPAGFFKGIDSVSRGRNTRWLTSLGGTLPVGRRIRTQGHLAYGTVDGSFDSSFSPDPSTSATRRLTARLQSDFIWTEALDLSAGVELQRERAESSFITGASFLPVPIDRSVAGYFVEGRWRAAQRLFVTSGIRVDDIRRESLEPNPNAFVPRPPLPTQSILSANPKISAAWYVRPDAGSFIKLRAAAGTGIRPPDGFELAFTDNPDLAPERSRSAEAGVDQAFASGRGLLEATLFLNNYDDLIVAVGSFLQSSRYRTDNISNARARGLELAGSVRTRLRTGRVADLQVRLAYTFLDTEILAVDRADMAPPPFSVGDPLLRRPHHNVSADVSLTAGRLAAYLRGGGRSRVLDVEPSSGTFGGLFHARGYQVWNAGASWRVHRALELFGRLDNLFDRTYEQALGFPAPGRGAMAGVRVAAGR